MRFLPSRECFSSGYVLARNFDSKKLKHRKKWRPEGEITDLSVLDELKALELQEDDHEEPN